MFQGGKYDICLSFLGTNFSVSIILFRVNLIGEHVDYCGYPVLPMAIEQSILLAAAPADDEYLHISNVNDKYKSYNCLVDSFV